MTESLPWSGFGVSAFANVAQPWQLYAAALPMALGGSVIGGEGAVLGTLRHCPSAS